MRRGQNWQPLRLGCGAPSIIEVSTHSSTALSISARVTARYMQDNKQSTYSARVVKAKARTQTGCKRQAGRPARQAGGRQGAAEGSSHHSASLSVSLPSVLSGPTWCPGQL
jgi:hypothetical protein